MPQFHKFRRRQIRYSHLAVVTIFWVMFIFSAVMSVVLIKYVSNIHTRRDMQFISYNLPHLARAIEDAPDEMREFISFNIHSMLLQIKMVRNNMGLFTLSVLFFNLNSLIMMFVAYRKNKRLLYIMSFITIVFLYFTFTFAQQAMHSFPKKVMGAFYMDEEIFEQIE